MAYDTAAIQALLDAASEGDTITLEYGQTYTLEAPIIWPETDGLTLDLNQAHLVLQPDHYAEATSTGVTSPGSTSIEVDDASGFEVGDWICIFNTTPAHTEHRLLTGVDTDLDVLSFEHGLVYEQDADRTVGIAYPGIFLGYIAMRDDTGAYITGAEIRNGRITGDLSMPDADVSNGFMNSLVQAGRILSFKTTNLVLRDSVEDGITDNCGTEGNPNNNVHSGHDIRDCKARGIHVGSVWRGGTVRDCYIEGCGLDQPPGQEQGGVFLCHSVKESLFEDILIVGCAWGLEGIGYSNASQEDSDNTFRRITIVESTTGGIQLYHNSGNFADDNVFIDCEVRDCTGHGVHLDCQSGARFTNCKIHGNSGYGIFVDNDYEDLVIDGCEIYGNTLGGVSTDPSATRSGFVIKNSLICSNGGDYGLYLYRMGSPEVFNCVVSDNDGIGIGVNNCSTRVDIGNCTVTRNGGNYGIGSANAALTHVIDTVVWANDNAECSGGIDITYSDVQGGYSGTGNINTDPELAVGRGSLGLALYPEAAALQGAGSDTAANLGLDERTTLTSLHRDSGTVALGYHFSCGGLSVGRVPWAKEKRWAGVDPGFDVEDVAKVTLIKL